MKCIVGLGNPGKDYELTRHNVGFMAIDRLRRGGSVKREKNSKLYWHALLNFQSSEVENSEVVLVKSNTFMNLSGQAVLDCFNEFCKLDPENLLVVVDDVNLPLGQIRIRSKGSSGGHNGLESIMNTLGTSAFPRLRIGIGKEGLAGRDLTDYVLGKFTKLENERLGDSLRRAELACKSWVAENIVAAMNLFNQKDSSDSE